MNKWYTVNAGAKGVAEITMFGDIGYGYSFADFNRDVSALGPVKEVNVRINSNGGDVFQGFAIYDMLKRMKANVRITVEGIAASMASVILMAGDERIMPENAYLMVHNPAGSVEGGSKELASFADMLTKLENNIVQAYVDGTGLDADEVRDLMDKTTWLSAKQAVKLGFADTIEKPVKVAAVADLSRFKNVPKRVTALFSSLEQEGHDMADRKEVNAQIKRVCALAGKADAAAKFIDDELSVEDVMKELETSKATDKAVADAEAKAVADAEAKAKGKSGDDAKVDAAAIRAAVVAEHTEIKSLCALAGFPDKADGFIVAGKSRADVLTALAEAKAAAEDKKVKTSKARTGEINARRDHRPEGGNDSIDTFAIWDKFNNGAKAKAKA